MTKKQRVIAYANYIVGVTEKDRVADIHNNNVSGSKNYNQFAPVCHAIGLFGGHNKQSCEWCTSAVGACVAHGYTYKEAVEGILCQSGDYAASCKTAAGYFKAAGRFDMTPQIGDQIFFIVGKEIGHTGLVVDVDGEYITTVEGNYKNMVAKNRYKIGDPTIGGYGHPRYDEYEGYTPTFKTQNDISDTDTLIWLPEMKKGDKGAAVVILQYIASLFSGQKLDIDGDYGDKTAEAVKIMQTALGLTVDGVVGRETLTAAIPAMIVAWSNEAKAEPDNEQSTKYAEIAANANRLIVEAETAIKSAKAEIEKL